MRTGARDRSSLVTASVALLLMISAVNVLGVLVARAAARRREIAVRVALGAGLARILRLSLAEGVTLAVLGAALGARWARPASACSSPSSPRRSAGSATVEPRRARPGLDLRLALMWAGLFALAPLREFPGRRGRRALRDPRRRPAACGRSSAPASSSPRWP